MDLATVGIVVVAGGAIASLNSFSTAAGRATGSANVLTRASNQLSSTMVALGLAFGVREAIQMADTWTLLSARVRLVTSSHEQANAVLGELVNISKGTRSELDATATMYTRLARSAEQLGLTQREVLGFTEALGNAQLVAGSTGVEAAQSMRQLSQALSAGKVQGDEFRTMMEAMPIVAKAVQDRLGITQKQLYEFSRAGKISAQEVVQAMLGLREEFAEQAKTIPMTFGQAMTNLGTDMTVFIGRIDQAYGITKFFTAGIVDLGNNLNKLAALIVAGVSAWALYRGALIAINLGWILFNTNIKAAIANSVLMTSIQSIQAFFNLAKGVRSVADAMALLSGSAKGVAGLIATIGAIALGYAAYNKLQQQVAESTKEWEAGLSTLDEKIGNAAVATEELTNKERRRLKTMMEWRSANAEMVREAQQGLELSGRVGMAEQELQIKMDATNEIAKARSELAEKVIQGTITQRDSNVLLAESLTAIGAAEMLNITALQNRARVQANFRRSDTIDELRQEVMLSKEYGYEQEKLAASFAMANAELEARRNLTGEALEIEIDTIRLEGELRATINILQQFSNEVQNTLSGVFEKFFSGGVKSFEDFFSTIKGMFTKFLAEMMAAEVMRKWGGKFATALSAVFAGTSVAGAQAPSSVLPGGLNIMTGAANSEGIKIAGITVTARNELTEMFVKLIPYFATALAGFGAGGMVGGAIGRRTGSVALGALGGAAAGAATGAAIGAMGGPLGVGIGALVGGLAGLVGGFLAAKKGAEEYRERMAAIAEMHKAFARNMEERELALVKGREDELAIMQLQHKHEEELRAAREAGIFSHEEMIRLINLQAAEEEALRQQQRERIEEEKRAAQEAYAAAVKRIDAEREALRMAELVMRQDMKVNTLRLLGLEKEAEDLKLMLDQRREMEAARKQGISAEGLGELETYHALQRLALEAQRAREAREAEVSRLEKELKAIQDLTKQQISAIQDRAKEMDKALQAQAKTISEALKIQDKQLGKSIDAAKDAAKMTDIGFAGQIKALKEGRTAADRAIKEHIAVNKEALKIAERQLREMEQQTSATRKVVESLREFASSISLNPQLGILSPEGRMDEAQRQFTDLFNAAMGGNTEAGAALPDAATNLLEAARVMFASSPGYVDIFRQVENALALVANGAESTLAEQERQYLALEAQVAQLSTVVEVAEQTKEILQNTSDEQIAALEVRREEARAQADAQIEAMTLQREQLRETAEAQLADITLLREALAADTERQVKVLEDQLAVAEQGYADQIAAVNAAGSAAETAIREQAKAMMESIGGNLGSLIDIDVKLRDLTQEEVNELKSLNAKVQELINQGATPPPPPPPPPPVAPENDYNNYGPNGEYLLAHSAANSDKTVEQMQILIDQVMGLRKDTTRVNT